MSTTNLNNFENVLQLIHSKYISLPEHEVRRNNEILNRLLTDIINEMKKDALFAKLYNRIFYGGSYFDGLRVGKPEEFDLDILLKVPKIGQPSLDLANEPGYLWLRFLSPLQLDEVFRRKMLDGNNYMSTKNVREWMISVVTKATNKFRTNGGQMRFEVAANGSIYQLTGTLSTSGPAVTLKLKSIDFNIDVDLVPCLEFTDDKWPSGGYRRNPVSTKNTFFIVPKSPKDKNPAERYWRLSFQEQERKLIDGKERLKPTLKLLKMLRDVENHKAIASYYIKTIFLWEDEKNGASYWNANMTETFFKMLDKYITYIESGKIPYFWNKKNNLLNLNQIQLDNMRFRLRAIQKDILAKYKTDPLVICRYLNLKLVEGSPSKY